jgi:uncharacterized coiled-coil protein SlyX
MNSPIKRFGLAPSVALIATFAFSIPAFAQSQNDSSPSVAEAARKAKERKKTAPKENRVITEDTLNLRPASADATGAPPPGTVVTTAPDAAPSDGAAGTASAPAVSTEVSAAEKPADASTSATDSKKKAEAAAAAAKTKELLAQAQSQLDVLKRELALDLDSYYSNPDYARDTNGKAKLEELKQFIGDRQISVDELKRQLTELLEKAGVSADQEKPAAPPRR